jgi:SAM-dependent methyltransferase
MILKDFLKEKELKLMKENKYDHPSFFEAYSHMTRSQKGLEGAGEWHALKQLLPDFKGKRMLDLGCGYGWHCRYAAENGAVFVLGVDLSTKMLEKAQSLTTDQRIHYQNTAIEDLEFSPESFDIVLSSLALHYISDFDRLCSRVHRILSSDGAFVFSVEHPIFTASGSQDWIYDSQRNKVHWPVDNYFKEGERKTSFLGQEVLKYHRTLDTYMNGLLNNGFNINGFVEPKPEEQMLAQDPDWEEELRRPMMLIISSTKTKLKTPDRQ